MSVLLELLNYNRIKNKKQYNYGIGIRAIEITE